MNHTCMGGHFLSAQEQNTQHPPSLGFMTNPHFLHLYKTRQLSEGIVSKDPVFKYGD
ncbi:MAG: hypothetical protein KKD69_04870 [Euryarchaeota archaeon]|nr:hypothetical protein [Euryarchaeota archaeon]